MFTPHPKVRCFLFHDKLLGGCLTVLVCSFQDIDARIEVVDERCAGFYVHFSYGSSVYGVNRDMHIRAGTNGGPVVMAAYFYSVSLGNVFLDALGILSRIEVQAIDVGTDIIPVGQVIDYVQVMYSAYVVSLLPQLPVPCALTTATGSRPSSAAFNSSRLVTFSQSMSFKSV